MIIKQNEKSFLFLRGFGCFIVFDILNQKKRIIEKIMTFSKIGILKRSFCTQRHLNVLEV